ncbi:MAG: hypothetical protein PVJ49_17315 [Acidobacteriota bacterium]|jgi:hypothetical protein
MLVVACLVVAYACLYVMARVVSWALFDVTGIELRGVSDRWAFVACIVVSATLFILVVDTTIAGRLPRPRLRRLLTFMAAVLFLGIAIEISLNAATVTLIGRKSWEYRVWPRHHGYTSGVAAFMWPLYGAHLCLLEEALRIRGRLPQRQLLRSLLGGVDAMTMEIACNAWAIGAFGTYYFYYLAPDLLHLSAAEIFVPYVFANLLLARVVRAVEGAGARWWLWCVVLAGSALSALFLWG